MKTAAGWIATDRDGDRMLISAGGGWTIASVTAIDRQLAGLDIAGVRAARIDLGALESLDTAGAWLLHRTVARLRDAGIEPEIDGAAPAHAALLDRVAAGEAQQPLERAESGPLAAMAERVGRAAVDAAQEGADLLSFLGLVTITVLRAIRRPGRHVRMTSVVSHLERVGLNAMPIVGLLSFLIGVVVAYQSADQLRRFGAEIFTVNLLGISILREMGILLAAIIIAGRSGSAFTAQIGTMQVNQEVDAMEALGLDPVEILVLPRIIALVIALPLLAVFADLMGLVGGAVMVVFNMDISLIQFMERLRGSVSVWSFWVGIIKAPVFGFIIALVGCREGLKVGGSAESVGQQTTRAVVVSIFLVILTNALFSILFSVLKI